MRKTLYKTFFYIFVFLLFTLLPYISYGQNQPQIVVEPDRDTVGLGDVFNVTVRVSASGTNPEITLRPSDAFQIIGQSTSSSFFSSFSFGNNGIQVQSSITKTFTLRAIKPGRQQIGPFNIISNGQTYQGGIATITVGNVPNQNPNQPSISSPQFGQTVPNNILPNNNQSNDNLAPPEMNNNQNIIDSFNYDPNVFVRIISEPAKVYVGQEIYYTLYLYCNSNIGCRGEDVIEEPGTDGFWGENLLGPVGSTGFQYEQNVYDNSFSIAVLRRLALFPIKAGKLTINPAKVGVHSFSLGIWGGSQKIIKESQPITIDVLPLPAKGQPANFFSGNVGQFQIKSTLDREQTELGQPVVLSVIVSGQGNMHNIKLSPLNWESFKIYEPQTREYMLPQGDKIGGEKIWEFLILPQKVGQLTLPSIALSYFDPSKEEYKTINTEKLKLAVTPSRDLNNTSSTDDSNLDSSDEQLNKKSLRLIRENSKFRSHNNPLYLNPIVLFFLIGSPFLFLFIILFDSYKNYKKRLSDKNKSFDWKKELKQIKQLTEQDNSKEFYFMCSKLLENYIEYRLQDNIKGLTKNQLKHKLLSLDWDEELVNKIIMELESIDFARYSPVSDKNDKSDTYNNLKNLINDMESI